MRLLNRPWNGDMGQIFCTTACTPAQIAFQPWRYREAKSTSSWSVEGGFRRALDMAFRWRDPFTKAPNTCCKTLAPACWRILRTNSSGVLSITLFFWIWERRRKQVQVPTIINCWVVMTDDTGPIRIEPAIWTYLMNQVDPWEHSVICLLGPWVVFLSLISINVEPTLVRLLS